VKIPVKSGSIQSQRSTHVSRPFFREDPGKFNLAGWVIVLDDLRKKNEI